MTDNNHSKAKKKEKFSESIKRQIASHCRSKCVYPNCNKLVRWGQLSAEELKLGYSHGYFAHIIPASSKGPRSEFIKDYSNLNRKGAKNGLLLCDDHHKKIDNPLCDFHPETLFAWRENAEKYLSYIKKIDDWDVEIDGIQITDGINEKISLINNILQSRNVCLIRIEGLLGIGKKTLVKFALNKELSEISSSNIFVAPEFVLDNIDKILDRYARDSILILYDISPGIHTELENRIRASNLSKYKIISIGTGEEYKPELWSISRIIEVKRHPKESIELIIKTIHKGISPNDLNTITNQSKGIPGIAKSLAEIYDPNDLSPNFDEFLTKFCNFFEGRVKSISVEYIKILNILKHLTLFSDLWWFEATPGASWFNYEIEGHTNNKNIRSEFSSLIGYSKSEVELIIDELIKIKIVEKKGKYISISYPVLVNYFFSTNIGIFVEYYEKVNRMDSLFLINYLKRLEQFAFQQSKIQYIVKKILALPNLDTLEKITKPIPSKIIQSISKIDHLSLLVYFERIFRGKKTPYLLNEFIKRRQVVFALQHCIWFKNGLERSMDLLLVLAKAENEPYTNNATGVFSEIFRVFLPGTEASLAQRMNYLQKKIEENPNELEFIIKQILSVIFDYRSAYRSQGPEIQGNRQVPPEYKTNDIKIIKRYLLDAFDILTRYFKLPSLQKSMLSIVNYNLRTCLEFLEKKDKVLEMWKIAIKNNNALRFQILAIIERISDSYELPLSISNFSEEIRSTFNLQDKISIAEKEFWKIKEEERFDYANKFAENIKNLEDKELEEILRFLIQKNQIIVFYIGDQLPIGTYNERLIQIFLNMARDNRQIEFFAGYFRDLWIDDSKSWFEILNIIKSREGHSRQYFKLILYSNKFSEDIIIEIEKLVTNWIIQIEDINDLAIRLKYKEFNQSKIENLIKIVNRCYPWVIINEKNKWQSTVRLTLEYSKINPTFIIREREYLLSILLNFEELPNISYRMEFSRDWKELILLIIATDDISINRILGSILKNLGKRNVPNDFHKEIINPIFISSFKKNKEIFIQEFRKPFDEMHESINFFQYYFNIELLKIIDFNSILFLCNLNPEAIPPIFIQIIQENIRKQEGWNIASEIWVRYNENQSLLSEILKQFTSGVHIYTGGQHVKVHDVRLKILNEFKQLEMNKTESNLKKLNLIKKVREKILLERKATIEEDNELKLW